MKTFNPKAYKHRLVLLMSILFWTTLINAQAFLKAGTVVFDMSNETRYRSGGSFQSIPQFYIGGGFDIGILEHFDLEIGANFYKSQINDRQEKSGKILDEWMLGLPIILKMPVVKNLMAGLGVTPSLFLNPESRARLYFHKSNISGTINMDYMPVKHVHLELGYNRGLIPKKFYNVKNGKEVIDPNFQSFYKLGLKYGF